MINKIKKIFQKIFINMLNILFIFCVISLMKILPNNKTMVEIENKIKRLNMENNIGKII